MACGRRGPDCRPRQLPAPPGRRWTLPHAAGGLGFGALSAVLSGGDLFLSSLLQVKLQNSPQTQTQTPIILHRRTAPSLQFPPFSRCSTRLFLHLMPISSTWGCCRPPLLCALRDLFGGSLLGDWATIGSISPSLSATPPPEAPTTWATSTTSARGSSRKSQPPPRPSGASSPPRVTL